MKFRSQSTKRQALLKLTAIDPEPRPHRASEVTATKLSGGADLALSLTTQAGFLAGDVAGLALGSTRASGESVGNYAVTHAPGVFTIQGAFGNTALTLAQIESLRETAIQGSDAKKLDDVLELLADALDPSLWAIPADGVRLDRKNGDKGSGHPEHRRGAKGTPYGPTDRS